MQSFRPLSRLLTILFLVCVSPAWAADTDGDGIDDSIDKFPSDPVAWEDTDNDGKPDDFVLATASDGFESNSFSTFGWVTSNPYPWTITTSYKSEGARGAISSSTATQTNYIEKTITASQGGQLVYSVFSVASFFTCASGGSYYGGSGAGTMEVRVDGAIVRTIACGSAWTTLSVPLQVGTHTYRFQVPACTFSCSSTVRWALDNVRIYDTALVEDTDDDNDGYLDTVDPFPKDSTENADNDKDGIGDNADTDDDDDSVPDVGDNCPKNPNVDQIDGDGDGLGYACDPDIDNDGQLNGTDTDDDNDGVANTTDFYPFDASRSQGDSGVLYTFYGDNANDSLGFSVSGAGDVNGDGYGDLVAGIPFDDNTGTDTGSIRVLSGANGNILYTVNGQSNTNNKFGFSVSGAGDMDGDGSVDIVVGAPNDTDGTNSSAGSYWFINGASGVIRYFTYGNSSSDSMGMSVAGAGDINKDGYNDVVIGAPADEASISDTGCAKVVNGNTTAVLYTFCGLAANDSFGYSVSGAGDVNADGYPDVVVGAANNDTKGSNTGMVRVFSGQNGSVLYTFYGTNPNAHFGEKVSGAGDVNNDGYADVIVGAYWDDLNGKTDSGSARVYSGKTGAVIYTFSGDFPQDYFGTSVSGAGDVNNDGYADVMVGAYGADRNGSFSGLVSVFSGQNGSLLYRMAGDSAADNFGYSVAAAGDVNGDGYADMIVGAPYDDQVYSDFGMARVFSGKARLLDTDSDGQNDAVDIDDDNDGVSDLVDRWPLNPAEHTDTDGDNIGNNADTDDDNDGWIDADETTCGSNSLTSTSLPLDTDSDHLCNVMDSDDDNDGLADGSDNCSLVGNLDQADFDGDSQGDACDTDDDNDGVADTSDKFPFNDAASLNSDTDAYPDSWNASCNAACQLASGLVIDNCPTVNNSLQRNADGDAAGDACDSDNDNDGAFNTVDSFPYDANRVNGNNQLLGTFYGDSAFDFFGQSVSGAGDVNGDGYADVIIGAPWDDLGGDASGSARVISGINNAVLYTLAGSAGGELFGNSVGNAGDVNKDGYADVIVGAPGGTVNGTDSGAARVFSGANGGVIHAFNGDGAGDQLGRAVSGAGDVNKDGYPDLIVGAPYDDNNGADSGSARVYSGANGGVLYTFYGDSAGDSFGWSVSGAGDVNDDGYADVIVGAPYADSSYSNIGMVRVFSGQDGSVLYTFSGEVTDDYLGYSVSGAGDMNGDGHADVVAGAYGYDVDGLTAAGLARVYSGATGAMLYNFYGDSPLDNLGYSVSGAGDVNQDGYPDIVVGIPYDDNNNGNNNGSARVLSGSDGSILYTFNGALPGDSLGSAVSGAGDVNGDGYADILAGAALNDQCGTSCGSARLLDGKPGLDTDGDGFSDDVDSDDDNDGVADTVDLFPLSNAAAVDLDFDGMPDQWNAGCNAGCQSTSGLIVDADDDNDGVVDVDDAFPYQAEASTDTDSDGMPDQLGSRVESFESGNFSQFSWHMAGNQPWSVTSSSAYSGTYSARSGVIANNQVSSMEMTVYTGSQVSFAVRITSLTNNNQFVFYVDGVQRLSSSGGGGTWNSWPITGITPGRHTLTWSYVRGQSNVSSGDAVYIDQIDFGTLLTEDADDDNDGIADSADKFPLDASRWQRVRHNTDFDNDSDVLIRSASTGAWISYGIQNNTVIDAAVMNAYTSSSVQYQAQLDANGDGDADILTRNTATGAWYLHQVQGGAVTGTTPIYLYANLDQQFVGTGDFNNDGTDDVMLRSASAGYYTVFLLSNHAVSSTVYYNAWVSAQSVPQGIGDFDGDGTDDLLVRRTSDNLYFIFKTTNGATSSNYCACNIWANTDWSFQFAGDTNKDGIDDIVVRGTGASADGKWWAFRMNNFSSVLTTNLNLFLNKTAVSVGAVGDYNGDGTIDVLTRVNNSTTYVSPIVNGTVTGNYWLYNFTADQVIGK